VYFLNKRKIMTEIIKNNVVVTMAYTLTVDGEVVEEATTEDPMYYLHGHENIVPGLEAALVGKTVGTKLSVTLSPEQAYGEYNDENVQEAALEDFNLDPSVQAGDEIEVEDETGQLYIATVLDISDETIVLDFNEPYAGKTVTFDVEVLNVRPATVAEQEIGEPEEYFAEFDEDEEDQE